MESMLGQTLGQYQLVEQIGKGGMATVYKAYQPSLERYVAVKILPAYFAHEPGFAERFTREAKAIAQLDHPNILPVYDFGKQGDTSYIVMKYVPAGTLHDKLGTPMSPAQALSIIEQVAGALDHAHEKGILHRDIKPSNILIDDREWVYLSDFGLAKMVEGSVQLTGSGVGVGTPSYMSPEQGKGLPVDGRTDVYALGVVLFEMLTGRVPYEAETPMAVVIKHITDPVPLPRQVNPNIPDSVERVLLKAMAKERDDRFASAGDLAGALRRAVQELAPGVAAAPTPPEFEHTVAQPTPPPSPPPVSSSPPAAPATPAKKRSAWLPVMVGLLGLGLLAACILVGVLWFSNQGGAVVSEALVSPTLTPLAAQSIDTATPTPAEPTPTETVVQDTPTPPPTDTPTPLPTNTPVPDNSEGSSGDTVLLPTDTPTVTPSPSPTSPPPPTATFTPTPPRWTDTGLRPSGRYADIWAALGQENSELGYPVSEPVGDRLCARQNFQRGYMVWFDNPQDPDPVWAAVMPGSGQSGDKSYKFTDTWPGSPEYWCAEAETYAPLGPKRGFGMLWCEYPALRADVGNAVDEEVGGPDHPRCAAQPFQGGAIVHTPLDSAYWVFIDNGGWYRFDQ